MTDSVSPNAASVSEIERLRALVHEVKNALNNQQELLRRRGMSLPGGMTAQLDQIESDLLNLDRQLKGDDTELSQLRALTATSALINSSLDLDTVLARAMDEVIRLTGANRGYIILRDREGDGLELRVSRDPEAPPEAGVGFGGSSFILNEVLATGKPLRADNAYKDPRMQSHRSIASMTLRSVVCVPLTYKDTVIGAVYVDNRLRDGVFTEREEKLMVAFANQAAVAIENARLFARVQAALAETNAIQAVMANVFDSIGSGVITTNTDDEVMTFNPAAAEILACAPEAALGQPLALLMPRTGCAEVLRAVRETGVSQMVEAELDVPERGRRALSLKYSPLLDAEGQVQGAALVVDDLTDQRAHEEKIGILRRYLPPALVENVHLIDRLARGGEKLHVTAMFVDVRPVATFPPGLRPAQVMALLNEHLSVATACIHHTDGVIDKYMGTEVMALFNTQLNPMADHARRAVEAALLMREAFGDYYQRQGIHPEAHFYRIGIHSGVATIGNVGSLTRRDFTALGDTINLCHRLLENSTAGQIIISEDTRRYMHEADAGALAGIRLEGRPPVLGKGKTHPTQVYEVFRS